MIKYSFMNKIKYNKILGDLEKEIMEIIWREKSCSVRDVLENIKRKQKPAYTTVMTVMARLYDKNILKRNLNDYDAYIYTPVQPKENFLASASKKIINNLIHECGEEVAVAQFIDVLENSTETKSKDLRKKLKKAMKHI